MGVRFCKQNVSYTHCNLFWSRNFVHLDLNFQPHASAELLVRERIPKIVIYMCHSCLQGLGYNRILALYFVGCFYLLLIVSCSYPCCFPAYSQLFDISPCAPSQLRTLMKTAVVFFKYWRQTNLLSPRCLENSIKNSTQYRTVRSLERKILKQGDQTYLKISWSQRACGLKSA